MKSQRAISSAQPAHPAARERQQLARRLLREASLELARLRRIRGAYRKTWRHIARAQTRLAFAAALLAAPLAEPALAGTPIFLRSGLAAVGERASPALADIDGDGDLDAFVGGSSAFTIFFFANTGTASVPAFAAPSTNPFGLAVVGYHISPVFADIDDDGDLDAFNGGGGGATWFYRNTGTATAPAFAAASPNPFGLASVIDGDSSPAFADLDGDGDLDAFVGQSHYSDGGDTIFFENTGTASVPAFAAPSSNPFGLANVGYWAFPAFADIDGDGDLDAFIGGSRLMCDNYCFIVGAAFFFLNTGTGSAPAFAAPSIDPFGLAFVDLHASSPAFADIDGDGDLDAFVGISGGNTIFFENTGTASIPAFASLSMADVGYYASPAFADLDDDGDLDAFVGNSYGDTIFFENTGTASAPTIAGPSTNPFGLVNVGGHASPAFADIDGDDDLDAFVGQFSGDTIFFENTGTASAPAFAAPSDPFGLYGYPFASPAFADIDGDGDLDAFVGGAFWCGFYCGYEGTTIFFENTGTASAPAFAAPSTNPFGLANVGGHASPAFADLDGDGDLDAFVGEGYGGTIFFANTGTASAPAFAAPVANPFGLAYVGGDASPAFADIDGDGDLDMFIGVVSGQTEFFENLELGPGTCADGLDNDFDGRIDSPSDPGCANAADPNERSSKQCDNGKDDDSDGKIDWRADGTGDPECINLSDSTEYTPPGWACGLGPELLLLGPLLAAMQRRRRGGVRVPQP